MLCILKIPGSILGTDCRLTMPSLSYFKKILGNTFTTISYHFFLIRYSPQSSHCILYDLCSWETVVTWSNKWGIDS